MRLARWGLGWGLLETKTNNLAKRFAFHLVKSLRQPVSQIFTKTYYVPGTVQVSSDGDTLKQQCLLCFALLEGVARSGRVNLHRRFYCQCGDGGESGVLWGPR